MLGIKWIKVCLVLGALYCGDCQFSSTGGSVRPVVCIQSDIPATVTDVGIEI